MPTGFTSAIKDGIDFKTFVMRCSRAWGPLIIMRDDPADAKIPEKFEPRNAYQLKKIKEAQALLACLGKMSLKQAQSAAQKEYEKEFKCRQDQISSENTLREKYNKMLNEVNNWGPPPNHVEFKKFMVGQIESSIKHDCNFFFYYRDHPIPLLTGQEWLSKSQDQALRDLEYHTKQNEQEIKAASSRTAWVQQLRKSLET